MSGNHHDDHHATEAKPVSFTVPFFLATAVLLIIILFLSLCDPKHGHHAEGNGHEAPATEAAHHDAAAMEEHHEETAVKDSAAAPAIAPEVEGKPEAAEHH